MKAHSLAATLILALILGTHAQAVAQSTWTISEEPENGVWVQKDGNRFFAVGLWVSELNRGLVKRLQAQPDGDSNYDHFNVVYVHRLGRALGLADPLCMRSDCTHRDGIDAQLADRVLMSGGASLEYALTDRLGEASGSIGNYRPYASNDDYWITANGSETLAGYTKSDDSDNHEILANYIGSKVVTATEEKLTQDGLAGLSDDYMADEPEVYRQHWYLPPSVLEAYYKKIITNPSPRRLAAVGYGPIHGNTYFYDLCIRQNPSGFPRPSDVHFPLNRHFDSCIATCEGKPKSEQEGCKKKCIDLDDYKRAYETALGMDGMATITSCGDPTVTDDTAPSGSYNPRSSDDSNLATHVQQVVRHYKDYTDIHMINSYAAINKDVANAGKIVSAIKAESPKPVWMWFHGRYMFDDLNDEGDNRRSFEEIRAQVYTAIASEATGVMIYTDGETSSTDLRYAGRLAAALHRNRDILSAKYGTTGTVQCGTAGTGVAYYAVKAVSRGESTDEYLLISNPTNGTCEVSLPRSLGGPVSLGARESRIRHLLNLQAQWVVDGAHVFAHDKARLTWDDPGNTAITGWEYRQQEGDSAWGAWQEASSSASTVTKVVEGLNIWRTYRFQVRARYADGTGPVPLPQSGVAVLSPWLDFTQVPTAALLGGDGKAQFVVEFDWPVDRPDLPEGSRRILPGNLQVQVVTVPATGEKTESEFVALSSIEEVLPGAALAEAPLEDLPPGEEPASGEAGARASSASSRAVSSFGVSGLKNGVTYQFKVRLVRPDGVTGPASATGSLLGLRQRRTGAVALSWTVPADPGKSAITAWQYRQQAGSESWGLWQSVTRSTGSTTSHTVTGLGAAETYRFQVRGIGPGGPFAESFTVSAPAVPSPPQNFTAVAGDGQVLVTWQAPASTGGSSLLGYHYKESGGGRTTGWIEFQKSWTRYLPQNLKNGVAYTIEVRAYNGAGAGASVDTTVTPAGAPRAPGDFTAAPGDGQVALSWTAADSNGAPITAYEVQYAPKSHSGAEVDWSDVTWSVVPGDSTARDTTITELSNGTPYGFRVAARNRVNLGTPAEKEATPQGNRGNRPPVITAPDTVWFAEHRSDSVATLSAADPEDDAVTWSHAGADVDRFEVRGDSLYFKMTPAFPSPDFEAPADADEDNFYQVTLTATDDGEPAASASHAMTVAVTNAPEAGRVTLNTMEPRVGMHLTATLTDPDQGVAHDRWSWEELDGASSARQRTQPPAQSQRYTVEDRVKGRRLLAKVTYTDGHGPDRAVSDTTAAVRANVPGPPGDLQAEEGDEQVELTWTAAAAHGSAIDRYELRYRRSESSWAGRDWSEVPGGGGARDTTVTGLTNDIEYVFQVWAHNGEGYGRADSVRATPQGNRGNRPPVITEPDTVWFAEHRTDSVATLSATDPEGQAIAWSHAGADVGLFKVRGDSLYFKMTPDFEAPADADEDNFYQVTLTATDDGEPAASASHDMTVAVTNAPEAGRVTLNTTQPRVGMHLTATLTDPDQGVINDRWSWEELGGASSAGQRTQPPAQSQRYTVEDRVKGRRLLAKVTYTDGHGPDQAVSDTTAAVRANVPGAPGSLQATAGDGRVTLGWTVADSNGAWITGYAYRDSAHTAGSTWSAWPETPPIAGDATSHPVTGLDNGTGYTFEVRAVNPVGAGPASSPASATPDADPECVITVSEVSKTDVPENSTPTVGVYEASANSSCGPLTWSRTGSDASRFQELRAVTGHPNRRSLHFVSAPNYEEKRIYSVTIRVSDPSGSAGTFPRVVRVTDVNEPPVITGPASKSVPENTPTTTTVATYTATDPEGHSVTWSVLGTDAADFQDLSDSGALRFGSVPNFESAADADTDNSYSLNVVATDNGSPTASSSKPVTVTVTNRPEAGRITLSPSTPMTCAHVNATLEDVDGGITTQASASPTTPPTFTYGWKWVPPSAGPSGSSGTSTTRSYLPANSSVGQTVQVTVRYGDRASDRNTATLTSGAVAANTPRTPTGLKSTGGDRQVSLSWRAPDNCGSTITGYRYWYRKKSQAAWEDSGDAAGTSVTVPGLDNDVPYRFEIRAANGAGRSLAAGIDGTPVPCVLSLSGPTDVNYAENGTGSVGTYRVTRSSACDATLPLTWSRAGTDASDFRELSGTGSSRSLRFNSAPNYEAKSSYSVTVQVTDGSASASRPVTVTVTNQPEAGRITLSPSTPMTCAHVNATLQDVDGGITTQASASPTTPPTFTYGWEWVPPSAGPSGSSGTSTTRSYLPANSSVGQTVQVTVRYGDRASDRNTATLTSGAVAANTPRTPTGLKSTGGDRQVSLSWRAPDNCGSTITGYRYWYRKKSQTAWEDSGGTAGTSVTVPGLDNDVPYRFEIRAANGAGRSLAAGIDGTPVPCVLSLSGPTDVNYAENGTGSVGTYRVTRSSSCDATLPLTWSRAGTNASAFKLTGTGSSRSLRFNSAPNYEAKSSYSVTVQVTDGSASASRPVTVTVTNADDPGVVTLDRGRPKVGEHVTATLTDEDGGITGPTWSWSTESGAAGQASSVQSFRYTVPSSDVGQRLQASVSYTDNHGSGKSASGRSSVVRANTPTAPPGFRAVRGNGQVALSWGAADGRGAAVDRYDIRRAGAGWTAVPGAGSARDTTVTGLTNGTSYAFEVRAHNGAGNGAASSASATPATLPGAPTNLATDRQGGNGFMELTWGEAPANGSPVLHYYYRYKKTSDTGWRGWYRRAGGADARSKSWSNFDDGASYVFQVRARNGVGYGTTAQISAAPLGPGGTADDDGAGGHVETEDELMPEGEVPEPGEDEVVVVAKPVAEGPAGWLAAADSLAVRSAPNPFNPSTTLHFQLPEAGPVTLTVYNVAGQVVAELARGEVLEAGRHAREWHGTDERGRALASGLYLYRLIAGGQVRVGKIALIR